MLCIIFQYGYKLNHVHRILIGFEAILERKLQNYKRKSKLSCKENVKKKRKKKRKKERKKEVWNTNFKFVESRAELSTKFDISAESWIEYREF